jgi:hypothetical protein
MKKKRKKREDQKKRYIINYFNAIVFCTTILKSGAGSLVQLSTAKLPFLSLLMPVIACDWWSITLIYKPPFVLLLYI